MWDSQQLSFVPEGRPEVPIRFHTEVTSAASINLQPHAANPDLPRPYTPAHFGPDIAWSNCAPLVRTVLYTAVTRLQAQRLLSKGLPRQAEVAQGVPGRLRPRISWRFGTTRVVGRQPNAPAAFTPGEIPGTHFQRLSRPQGTWFYRGYHGKNPQWHHRESIPGPSD